MMNFHIVSCSKKIISIVLLMIIFTTTITSAVTSTDIKTIYDQIISGDECKAFMTTLYSKGPNLTSEPLSSDEINTRMGNFVKYVLNTSQLGVDDGTITKANYSSKIFDICMQKVIDAGLSELFQAAYPELIYLITLDDVSIYDVPTEMKPMYLLIANEVIALLGIKSRPAPTTSPSPKPSSAPAPAGGGGGGGGAAPGSVVIPALPPVDTRTFSDLQGVEWAETAINTLAQAGIISKNDEMKFNPLNNVKREEFVKLMVSGFNLKNPSATSDFIDVDKTSWYYPYVSSMAMLDLVKGFNNSFGTGQDITRQDIAVLLYRVMQHVGIATTPSEPELFNDDSKIADYAKSAVYIMRQIAIIKGTPENTFEPTSFATRAEAAQMIYNTYKIFIAKK